MVSSAASSVDAYLKELPADRREPIARTLAFVRAHLPPGFREAMAWGMVCWEVPLERSGPTYNGKPLVVAGLAAQKQYNALYLMGAAIDPSRRALLERAAAAAGKRFDMGKGCLRFASFDDIPVAATGAVVAAIGVDDLVAWYARAHPPKAKAARTAGPKAKASSGRAAPQGGPATKARKAPAAKKR